MAEFALRELIDEKRLQHLQNEFCKVTGVTAVCVDKEGRAITEPYIDKSLIRPDGEIRSWENIGRKQRRH